MRRFAMAQLATAPDMNTTSKIIGEGITFDDVLLVPQRSDVNPQGVDLATHLTRTIRINAPDRKSVV